MKKILYLTIIPVLFLLTGCSNKTDLIFTEYIEGAGNAKALEVYNPFDKEVDLEDYSIGIYKDGQTEMTYNINLEGTLEAKSCYVVVYSESPEELLNKADLVSSDLYYTGDDPIVLLNKEKVISSFGVISALSITYARDTTLVKVEPESNLGNNTYIKSDWVEYSTDEYKHLGTIEHDVTKEDLENGPIFNEEWLEIDFFPEGTTSSNFLTQTGTGGAVEVTVYQYGDGDTTCFNYPDEWDYLNIDPVNNRFRYFGVDTPESSSTVAPDPWGKTASNYVNNILENAEKIYIQSIAGYSVDGSFSRLMGLVWVDGVLLQHLIIKEGYSEFTHTHQQFSDGVLPITSYFKYNANQAELNEIKIWGEEDPMWDYKNNVPIGW